MSSRLNSTLSHLAIVAVLAMYLIAPACFAETDTTETLSSNFRYTDLAGIGLEENICRRDPSDVIDVDGQYYVWYTKVRKDEAGDLYPSGYPGTVWYATSKDGVHWEEDGEALGTGSQGAFDEHGVFTPNILVAEGKYYLFYTAVPHPYIHEQTRTAIGVAVSDSPNGPWQRCANNPVVVSVDDPERFDSFRVDDACLVTRDGSYWLYFKGRQQNHTPGETKMGVAMAERPEGPYVKYEGNPVLTSGHEVLVWPYKEGIMALVSPTGPEGSSLQYAPDGILFKMLAKVKNLPMAPGAFRPDAFTNTRFGQGISWGISMRHGKHPYLVRYDCDLTVSDSKADVPK